MTTVETKAVNAVRVLETIENAIISNHVPTFEEVIGITGAEFVKTERYSSGTQDLIKLITPIVVEGIFITHLAIWASGETELMSMDMTGEKTWDTMPITNSIVADNDDGFIGNVRDRLDFKYNIK